MQTQTLPVGEQLRAWRGRRRLSQLDLALDAEISARHLSFLETGRSRPSRPMLLRLAERLAIPARDRNLLLVAAGFAPALPERSLDDPALAAARRAVDLVLKAHEPFPALAVDRHWQMVAANAGVAPLLAGVARASARAAGQRAAAQPPSRGRGAADRQSRRMARPYPPPARGADRGERRSGAGRPARRAARLSGRRSRAATMLMAASPCRSSSAPARRSSSFLSTTTMFGTPIDITLAELAIEAFLPADAGTAEYLMGGKI